MLRLSFFRALRVSLIAMVATTAFASAQVWTPAPEIDRQTVSALCEHAGVLYAGTVNIVYRSTDLGGTWTAALTFPKADPYPDVTSFAAADTRIFAGTSLSGVLVSTDAGVNWSAYSGGSAGNLPSVYGLAVRGDSLYAITSAAGIYVRNIRTETPWRNYNNGLNWLGGTGIINHENTLIALISEFSYVNRMGDPEWTFLPWDSLGFQRNAASLHSHRGELYAGAFSGLYRWNGNAATWDKLSMAPAPNRDVRWMVTVGDSLFAVVQLSIGRHLLAVSSDAGLTWTIADDTQGEVHALHAAGGRLWSARTDGLWSRPLTVPTTVERRTGSRAMELHSPFPQPATDGVTLSFDMERAGMVTLQVLDALGRSVITVTEGNTLPAGRHQFHAATAALPRGMYIVRLTGADGMLSRPLVRQ